MSVRIFQNSQISEACTVPERHIKCVVSKALVEIFGDCSYDFLAFPTRALVVLIYCPSGGFDFWEAVRTGYHLIKNNPLALVNRGFLCFLSLLLGLP